MKELDLQTIQFPVSRSKPGRALIQFLPEIIRETLGLGATDLQHDYCVIIEPGTIAGNHGHYKKREIFTVLQGTVEVTFEDMVTKIRRTITLTADGLSLYVPTKVAHAVKNVRTNTAILFVHSNLPARIAEDDIHYDVIKA